MVIWPKWVILLEGLLKEEEEEDTMVNGMLHFLLYFPALPSLRSG